MKTLTIEHDDVKIIVSEATALIGIKRSRMKAEAVETPDPDPDRQIMAVVVYPDLIAPVVDIQGMDLPGFDAFLALPETLVMKWERVVYELNPHWLPGNREEQEKKA